MSNNGACTNFDSLLFLTLSEIQTELIVIIIDFIDVGCSSIGSGITSIVIFTQT